MNADKDGSERIKEKHNKRCLMSSERISLSSVLIPHIFIYLWQSFLSLIVGKEFALNSGANA